MPSEICAEGLCQAPKARKSPLAHLCMRKTFQYVGTGDGRRASIKGLKFLFKREFPSPLKQLPVVAMGQEVNENLHSWTQMVKKTDMSYNPALLPKKFWL